LIPMRLQVYGTYSAVLLAQNMFAWLNFRPPQHSHPPFFTRTLEDAPHNFSLRHAAKLTVPPTLGRYIRRSKLRRFNIKYLNDTLEARSWSSRASVDWPISARKVGKAVDARERVGMLFAEYFFF